MSKNPAHPTSYRTTSRCVTFEIALTGHPLIYQHHEDALRILVDSVRLCFHHEDGECSVTASLQGFYLLRNGRPGKTRANDSPGYIYERWPAWLQMLVDKHRPERYAEHHGALNI